ncbi:hypothetical protein F2Q69_00040268, partial [Brassica cretica]
VDGLEGQEGLCFVNANGTWYKKEPNFRYHNNYQQKAFYNNQQGGYQSTQGQVGSSTYAPPESSTNTMLKQILESQNITAKNIGDELKILHTKIDGNYNDLNNILLYGTKVVAKVEAHIVEKVEQKIEERVEIQTVKKVEEKVLQPVRHKAEKSVLGKTVTQLKEVQLEEAHTVKQSPYDKLPFPQRFLKVSMKFTKPHAALLSSPGMGHIIPGIELAKRLSAHHGFQVTVFVLETDAASSQSKYLNSTGVDVVNIPSPDISDLVDPADHVVTKIGIMMREAVPSLRSNIAAMIQKPTALIVDLFGTDALCLAAEFKMLTYVFMTTNARFLGVTIYYPNLEKDVKEEHTVQRKPLEILGCEPVQFEDTLDAYLVPDEPLYQDFVRHCLAYPKADGILVNTWDEMEPKSLKSLQDPKLLGRFARVPVYPIGPLCRPVESSKTVHPILDWLNNQPDESVLYISFGSGGSLTAKLLTELAWGLEQSQQRFVWVVRPPVDGLSCGAYLSVNSGGTKDSTPEYLPEGFVTRTSDRGLVVPSWAPKKKSFDV